MSIQHTAGLWAFYRHGQNFQDGTPIWTVWCEDELIADLCIEANARLIAAAPDLLVALNNAPVPGTMAWMTWYEGERKAAIDKAEEGQP